MAKAWKLAACGAAAAVLLIGLAGCSRNSEQSLRQRGRIRDSDDEGPIAVNRATTEAPKPAAQPVPAAAPAAAAQVAPAVSATAARDVPGRPGPRGSGPLRVVVQNARPTAPLSRDECLARSAANLEKIGQALQAFAAKHGRFPAQALLGPDGKKHLSWRVAILPELGYPELYEQFDASENWNGPRNSQLIAQIPPEYQSPWRFDRRTDYVAFAGPGMLFGALDGLAPSGIRDGPAETFAVWETGEDAAPVWTAPVDFAAASGFSTESPGGPQTPGALALMADGSVALVPHTLPSQLLSSLATVAGGEHVSAKESLKRWTAVRTAPKLAAGEMGGGNVISSSPSPVTPSEAAPGVSAPADSRKPVPDGEALARARSLLKEVYAKEFGEAKTPSERQAFARRLLTDAPGYEQSPADYYEVLRIARDIAAQHGDAETALGCSQLLEKDFRIDALAQRLQTLELLVKGGQLSPMVQPALSNAARLVEDAFQGDRFDIAIAANGLVLSLTRMAAGQNRDAGAKRAAQRANWIKSETVRLQEHEKRLSAARGMWEEAQQAFHSLEKDPADAKANEIAGKYLCLVKGQWDAGLPRLARGADFQWRGLAALDLEPKRSSTETLRLADEYWKLADTAKPVQKRSLQLRAIYLFEQAAGQLPDGLEKAKARKRVEDAASLFSREEIDRVLEPLRTAAVVAAP